MWTGIATMFHYKLLGQSWRNKGLTTVPHRYLLAEMKQAHADWRGLVGLQWNRPLSIIVALRPKPWRLLAGWLANRNGQDS